MNPLVSVIIPVYNAENYLAEAIASAQAQTYPNIEIIVVDDGSTDNSAAVAARFSDVQIATQPNGGISAARNRGIEMARGELFGLLDADDVWLPQKLELQIAASSGASAPDLVFGMVQEFISPELPAETAAKLHCEPGPVSGVIPSALLVSREAYRRVGPFATHWQVGEFADWMLRAHEAGLAQKVLNALVARRRIHSSNHGVRQRKRYADYVHMIKSSLDRRRVVETKDESD